VAFVYIMALRMPPLLPVEGKYVKGHKPEATEVPELVDAVSPI